MNLSSDENESTQKARIKILQRSRTAPSQLVIPGSQHLFARPFADKCSSGAFLGIPSPQRKSLELEQYRRGRCMGLSIFNQGKALLEPNEHALQRTRQAVKHFFEISHALLMQKKQTFPLANRNKCLGMVAIPQSKLVMIAISQDKSPLADEQLRKKMALFLEDVNQQSDLWRFELACIPTPSQYLMPRTLYQDIHHPARKEQVDPHTRCVEVALMVALNKIGRFKTFTPADVGVMAFGATLWASSDEGNAIDCFAGAERNKKYVKENPIHVELGNSQSAWVDIWEPCACHCNLYKYEMAAIGSAGGPSTSFAEPCSEWSVTLSQTSNSRSPGIN